MLVSKIVQFLLLKVVLVQSGEVPGEVPTGGEGKFGGHRGLVCCAKRCSKPCALEGELYKPHIGRPFWKPRFSYEI